MRLGRRQRICLLAASAVALAVAAAAAADTYTFRFTNADQAAARRAVVQRSDLVIPSAWTGGPVTPDHVRAHCPIYNPKRSDLVVTGDAATDFKIKVVRIYSDARVMQTAAMARLDFQRWLGSPKLLVCDRLEAAALTNQIVTINRLRFPHLAPDTVAIRSVHTGPDGSKFFVDVVELVRGRTVLQLAAVVGSYDIRVRVTILAEEIDLARKTLKRTSPD